MGRQVSGRALVLLLALPSLVCYLVLDSAAPKEPHRQQEEDPWPAWLMVAQEGHNNFSLVSETPGEGNTEEDYWLLDWKEIQRRRQTTLRSACHGIPKSKRKNFTKILNAKMNLYNILVDDKHRTLYCYIPKVACTNWKKVMMVLTGRSNQTNLLSIRSNIPHEESSMSRLSASSMVGYKLRTYTKFLMVRHPMERLVSAYRNKLVVNTTSAANFKRKYGISILKKYRPGWKHDNNTTKNGHGVTFPEFISYLVDNSKHHQILDEHWRPYLSLCHPCAIKYDIIGKYETLEEDAENILKTIGAPRNLHFPPFVTSHTASVVPSHLATLSDTLLRRLYNLYKYDFKLFRYDMKI